MVNKTTVAMNISNVGFEGLNQPFTVVLRLGGFLATFLNLLVIVCITTKHKAIPAIYRVQIICLAINDTLAGVSALMISYLDTEFFNKSLFFCCGAMSSFIAFQAAMLYNISIICIKRLIRIRKIGEIHFEENVSTKNAVLCTTIITLTCYVACLLPFIIWANGDTFYAKQRCSMETAFGENAKYYISIVFGTYIVPFLGTNTLYICVTLHLYRANKFSQLRHPVVYRCKNNASRLNAPAFGVWKPTSVNSTGGACHKAINIPRCVRLRDLRTGVETSPQLVISNQRIINKRHLAETYPLQLVPYKNKLLMEPRLSVISEEPPCDPMIKDMPSTSEKVPDDRGNKEKARGKEKHESTAREQFNENAYQTRQMLSVNVRLRIRNAYVLLGLILLFPNMFTLPGLTGMLIIPNTGSSNLGRMERFSLFSTVSFNALVNPFLYTFRIKQFRMIIYEGSRYIFNWFRSICLAR